MPTQLILVASNVLEIAGVTVIVVGSLMISLHAVVRAARTRNWIHWFRRTRHGIGRAILLGLELLVGADIIRTVHDFPSLQDVLVLGIIVVIRTFLSFILEVELAGRWPWQAARAGTAPVLEDEG